MHITVLLNWYCSNCGAFKRVPDEVRSTLEPAGEASSAANSRACLHCIPRAHLMRELRIRKSESQLSNFLHLQRCTHEQLITIITWERRTSFPPLNR